MSRLTSDMMPPCSMRRVIVHWTAGLHRASEFDKTHYHLLIESDGAVVTGLHPIDANAKTAEPRASHTRGCNTGSIGVTVCCMAGAIERPFKAGSSPMTEVQWNVMAEVVAELCAFYKIDVTSRTVLAHGEVEANLKIAQLAKWDPLVLPWNPSLTPVAVMEGFRDRVRQHRAGLG